MAARHALGVGTGVGTIGTLGGGEEPVQERGAVVEIGVVPLEAGAVVVLHQREPDGTGIGRLEQVADEHEVAERLRHLLALVAHHRRVHPVAGERLAGDALALRDLALVVREDEVGAAAVQVDGGAELVHGHHRALDVPAGATDAERRVATTARRAATAARARSRAGRGGAGRRGCRRARVRVAPSHRGSSATARRSAGTSSRRSTRCRGRRRRCRRRGAGRPSRSCRRSTRWRGARRAAGACRGHPCRSGSGRARPRPARGRAHRARGPSGRIESSTSVTLRTMRTSWPSSSRRRMRRS